MRAIKTITISVLAFGLLAGSAVGVMAQDEEFADPMAPAFFAVEYVAGDDFEFVEGTFEEVAPGLEKQYGAVTRGLSVDAEDPRASGDWTRLENKDLLFLEEGPDGAQVATVGARSIRVTNDAGSWEGTGHALANFPPTPDEASTVATLNILTGDGAYEGLTLILADTSEGDRGWGWIVPNGSVPPIPELPAE